LFESSWRNTGSWIFGGQHAPGKPIAFGHYQDIPFIGLPGNPVSAFVGFEVFIRPAIMKMSGYRNLIRTTTKVRLLEDVESDGREAYLRAIVSIEKGDFVARLTGHQGSGNLYSLVQANALLLIPSRVKSCRPEPGWMFGCLMMLCNKKP